MQLIVADQYPQSRWQVDRPAVSFAKLGRVLPGDIKLIGRVVLFLGGFIFKENVKEMMARDADGHSSK